LALRDSDSGPEIYMVRRHPRSAFMANALVFAGGRVDAHDRSPEAIARCTGITAQQAAQRLGLDDGQAAIALYVAALRECFEEAGLLLADGPLPGATGLSVLRGQLNRDEITFAELLARHDLTLPLDRLRYLAHWITPDLRGFIPERPAGARGTQVEHRRYDARFFVCRAPDGQEAEFDPVETTFGAWMTVGAILAGNRERTLHLAPPTLTILEEIGDCRSVEQILSRAPDRPVPSIMPRPLLGRTRYPTLLFPGDHRYDDPGSAKGPVHCVELVDGCWVRKGEGG